MKYSTTGSITKEVLPIHERVGRPALPPKFSFSKDLFRQEIIDEEERVNLNDPKFKNGGKTIFLKDRPEEIEEFFLESTKEKEDEPELDSDDEYDFSNGPKKSELMEEIELTPENTGVISSASCDGESVFIIREPGIKIIEEIENGVEIAGISELDHLPNFGNQIESGKVKSDMDYRKMDRRFYLSNKRHEGKSQISEKRNLRKAKKASEQMK